MLEECNPTEVLRQTTLHERYREPLVAVHKSAEHRTVLRQYFLGAVPSPQTLTGGFLLRLQCCRCEAMPPLIEHEELWTLDCDPPDIDNVRGLVLDGLPFEDTRLYANEL